VISNLNAQDIDSPTVYGWQTPSEGYLSGNGSLNFSTPVFFPVRGIGEQLTAPAGPGNYVSSAEVYFGIVRMNPTHADSALVITAYVYDTTGIGSSPGHALDSASFTLGSLGTYPTATVFNFTHQAILPGLSFFVTVTLPYANGDTLAVETNNGSTGDGLGWLNSPNHGGWVSYDTLTNIALGNFIFPTVCGPNISGIQAVNELKNVSVYPNPTMGIFTVSLNLGSSSDASISVSDMTGNKIYQSTDKAVRSLNKQINLSAIAPGAYIVNIRTNEGTTNRQIVIE
jgi:hypothetical protein